ncbi:MAG: Crp/Fnr family transcriptional regulator [Acidobacteria bacterium]|nr:MAG: Crp/Fnr family transcriptional regulator [Acidobacteriota bacterium]RPJ75191.1 MAG: Crp/Fnr family transcriptional regulator [Acidobacteriota bacterium]
MSLVADRTDLLARIPLFHTLSLSDVATVLNHSVRRRYQPGQTLFCEGDACTALHVLLSGHVKICKTSVSGREVALYIASAPNSLAEVPLFDGRPYPATAYALDAAEVLLVERDSFAKLCEAHPELPCRILASVGRRLRSMVALIESLTFGGVRQQLARLLLAFREEAGDDTLLLPVSTHEMAMRLGTAREVVSRNLSRFQANGLIRIHKRQLVILDREGLRHEAETEL